MELAETTHHPGYTPRGITLAIALSIGFHLLILWRLEGWYQTGWDSLSQPPLQRPLRVTLTAPEIQHTIPQQTVPAEPVKEQSPPKQPPPQTKPIDKLEADSSPHPAAASKPAIAGRLQERPFTAAQIKQSAASVIRGMSIDIEEKQGHNIDSVSAILERALNKPRETPGVYTQADGTTRVVTEQGVTYCIKAPDDWRIIDPGDDMRVSTYCQ